MADPAENSERQERCPACGATGEPGQLVCLECGGRLALDYRRPYGWKLPVALVALVVLLVGAGTALALNSAGADAEEEAARTVGPTAQRRAGEPKRPEG